MKYYRLNNQISSPIICLIDEEGKHLGNVEIKKALSLAQEKGLDLVEIGPLANPPVAKIMDFNQFKYELKRKDRQQKKQQKSGIIKGIRLSPRMGKHDWDLRIENAKKFLSLGQKVKIEMVVKGREKMHFDFVEQKMKIFIDAFGQEIKIEQSPKRQGNSLIAIISSSQ